MNRRNYQRELDAILQGIEARGESPALLLHSCCGPCSSYVLAYLSRHFDITVFFYNPNIQPREEFIRRAKELKRLIEEMPLPRTVQFILPRQEESEFEEAIRGLEHLPERRERCEKCFELRLSRAAQTAKEIGADYFTSTLSISPHKDVDALNRLGARCGKVAGIPFLPADFKKREGYKRSLELSREYGLYRQDYCGCQYSKNRTKE